MSLDFITHLIDNETTSPVLNAFETRLGRVDEVPPYTPIASDTAFSGSGAVKTVAASRS